ncbi:MAG: Tat pathway signal protein [Candidatus Latescibacterota bacterium]
MGTSADSLMWGQLVHLGYNMWADREQEESDYEYTSAKSHMRFDKSLWDDLLPKMAQQGVTTVVIDLGEGVAYESHPELAIEGSWSPDLLRAEIARIRSLGMEAVPKMNFATSHDEWLGEYSRCVSTPRYYEVCGDLIREAISMFDTPPLFHLGMDEETPAHQPNHSLSICRQHELWWHDLLFLVEQVERAGVRAWVWSDYVRRHPDLFFSNMPKSVLQSMWYYDHVFTGDREHLKAYLALEEHEYDQVPCGSTWTDADNFRKTVRFCTDHIAPERLKGFLMAAWKPTVERRRYRHFEAASEVEYGRAEWRGTT